MSDLTGSEASLETRADAGEGEAGQVKLWLDALDIADKAEADWRDRAKGVVDLYRDQKAAKEYRKGNYQFNILFSNVQTLQPAIYNSTPKPDVRRRFNDTDPQGRMASQVLERALNVQIDQCDFDDEMNAAVEDMLLPGRGVTRVRYKPITDEQGQVAAQSLEPEHVFWSDFRVGASRRWPDVPWVAFRHFLTREQVVKLNPKVGASINLDCTADGKQVDKTDEPVPDVFKRLMVWEVWDKDTREVVFIAPSYKAGFVTREPDPLRLRGFFPVPRPLYAVQTTSSLEPIEEYRIYKDQAEELDRITKRITNLISILKWRGIRDAGVTGFDALKDAVDGDLVPSESVYQFATAGGGIDKAIWMMPIEQVVAVLQGLYVQREQIKTTIYEITGIADIMRGSSNASETLGAQQLKAQWGSLRIQRRQGEVQRYCRDIMRIMAELIAEHFDPKLLSAMTGINVDDAVMQILKTDTIRNFRVDVETDSTIQADVQQSQKNMAEFVQGFGTFIQAVGPAVQAGVVPIDAATDLLTGFARVYKLGRQAEDALERIGGQRGPDGQRIQDPNAQQQQKPDPAAEAAQAEQAAAAQKAQAEQQSAQQKMAMDGQAKQMELAHVDAKHQQALAHKQQAFELDQKLKRTGANNAASAELGLEPDGEDPAIGIQQLAQAMAAMAMAQTQSTQALTAGMAQLGQAMAQIGQLVSAPRVSQMKGRDGRMMTAVSTVQTVQ